MSSSVLFQLMAIGTVLAGGGIGATAGALIGLAFGATGVGALVGLGVGLAAGGIKVATWW